MWEKEGGGSLQCVCDILIFNVYRGSTLIILFIILRFHVNYCICFAFRFLKLGLCWLVLIVLCAWILVFFPPV